MALVAVISQVPFDVALNVPMVVELEIAHPVAVPPPDTA
jgi:hypothetical protein